MSFMGNDNNWGSPSDGEQPPVLTQATAGSSWTSSTEASFSTPAANAAVEQEWVAFSERVGVAPPAKVRKTVPQMISIADELLATAGVTSDRWESLTDAEQAQMAFMINENLMLYFPTSDDAAKKMTKAVFEIGDEGEIWNRHLVSFVNKGGDVVCRKEAGGRGRDGVSMYQAFTDKHPVWKDSTQSTSIFSLYDNVKPAALRDQAPGSVVCSAVTAAVILDYSQRCRSMTHTAVTTDEIHDEVETTLTKFAMNINRFLRLELSGKEKYDTIFRSRGFRVSELLFRILAESNPGKIVTEVITSVGIEHNEEPLALYQKVQEVLKNGPLYTDRFRPYDEYDEFDTCVSGGPAKTYKGFHHAISITGATYTAEKYGGILFEVQEPHYVHPFKNIGLDLLRQMGIVQLEHIKGDVEFPAPGGVFDTDPHFLFTLSGGKSRFAEIDEKPTSVEEWKAPGGPLERWFAMTVPGYVPSWAGRQTTSAEPSDHNDA